METTSNLDSESNERIGTTVDWHTWNTVQSGIPLLILAFLLDTWASVLVFVLWNLVFKNRCWNWIRNKGAQYERHGQEHTHQPLQTIKRSHLCRSTSWCFQKVRDKCLCCWDLVLFEDRMKRVKWIYKTSFRRQALEHQLKCFQSGCHLETPQCVETNHSVGLVSSTSYFSFGSPNMAFCQNQQTGFACCGV